MDVCDSFSSDDAAPETWRCKARREFEREYASPVWCCSANTRPLKDYMQISWPGEGLWADGRAEGGDPKGDGRPNVKKTRDHSSSRFDHLAPATALAGVSGVGHHVLDFAGTKQFLFIATVSRTFKELFLGAAKETGDAEIVISVPRVLAAFSAGWRASGGAMKQAAAIGSLEVLKLLQGVGVEFCGGVFGAAAKNGNVAVLQWLILQEDCPKDDMGLKALQVAVASDSLEMISCCSLDDVKQSDRDAADVLAKERLKIALVGRETEMTSLLSRFITVSSHEVAKLCYDIALDGDIGIIRSLEDFIMDEDSPDVCMNVTTCAASGGHFRLAAMCLSWFWGDPSGQRAIPNIFLFFVARRGRLDVLKWCCTQSDIVSADFCNHCIDVDGWARVVEDAAGAGHVDMVLWCLENGWEFTDDIVESAAREGRSNVLKALEERALQERGYALVVNTSERGASFEAMFEKNVFGNCKAPRCEC